MSPAALPDRPLAPWTFLVLGCAISWGCWALVAVSGRDPTTDPEAGTLLVLGGFGPFLAAVILLARQGDATDLGLFWRLLVDPRLIRPPLLLPVLLLYPAAVAVAFVASGAAADLQPLQALLAVPGSLLLTVAFAAVFGPIAEEPGWRG